MNDAVSEDINVTSAIEYQHNVEVVHIDKLHSLESMKETLIRW